MNYIHSKEVLREMGKRYFFKTDSTPADKSKGISLLTRSAKMGDAEAQYYVADFVLKGILTFEGDENPQERAIRLMCDSANAGCIQARAFLNDYCQANYDKSVQHEKRQGKLVDFEGKEIKINRKGIFTPIDAVLEYVDETNILTLSTNVMFLYLDPMPNYSKFEQAVREGIMAWEGEYEVFGGQKLTVKVNLTTEERIFDNIIVAPVTEKLSSSILAASRVLSTKKRKENLEQMMTDKRSFASSGFKWTVNSRKLIYIQSKTFTDYEEMTHVAKHEFGHALGLGDLYSCESDNLEGVQKGTYKELDSYAISDKLYNLVMCDHHGPISNNDIEMVVLAFSENKMQIFQPGQIKGKISKALGKGN